MQSRAANSVSEGGGDGRPPVPPVPHLPLLEAPGLPEVMLGPGPGHHDEAGVRCRVS